ncbi:endonuclease MutS2 [uncultured Clostridium sp.]|uniref:endonuclease MutS2 n=1 Tax=uncultured Clostridium sp. TaxID=59620 RepID=UPI0028E7F8A5|nr:endonuclease MutS2 [uncultured Clostridium sp.]
MNNITFEKLQYNELKELIKSYCVSGLGKELIDKLEPSNDIKVVQKRLKETSEGKNLLNTTNHIPLEGLFNIKAALEKIEKGGVLSGEELTIVSDFLRGCRKVKQFMIDKEAYAPTLSSYAASIAGMKTIEEEINNSIKGNTVDSSASKELRRIRRHIENTESKIQEKLNKFLASSENKKYIQEFYISKRNDRYVIPIKATCKNQVDGVIVDTSSKGSTVFMEPNSIGKFNIELVALKSEEACEVYQILSYLTGLVYEKIREIKINLELMGQYDMVFAKAKYSNSISGIEPKVNDYGYTKIIKGKHPLLTGEIVPLNFEIGRDYRSLIITGPNAGGKTVVLKTLGLLTLALQSGFHVSAAKDSEFSIFDRVFVDIGDNQSLENSLSTFSSHINNLAQIMKEANRRTLLLFDEIGTGTEPNEGAALAISILEEFYHMGCITIATTHYGEIKKFGENHPEFQNACMQFNPETLEPLYKLTIGKSGESNALWIGKKMGLKEGVLKRAKGYIEKKDYNLDLVKRSKIKTEDVIIEAEENTEESYKYKIGDKIRLLDYNDFGIVYKEKDELNNIKVLYGNKIIEVNIKRVELFLEAENLYPKDYDLNSLFTSYEERKLKRDIERGSKKALKKVQKEMRRKAD